MAVITNNSIRPMGKNALRSVERQRQMAQALQGQSMQPLRGQMAGRVYVPPSPFQGAEKLAQMLAGNYVQGQADDREKQIESDQRQAFATDMQAYQDSIKGTPMVPGTPETNVVPPQGVQGSETNPYIPASGEFKEAVAEQAAVPGMERGQAAMQHLMNSNSPMAQRMGEGIYGKSLEPAKLHNVAPGAVALGADGKPVFTNEAPAKSNLSSGVRNMLAVNGIKPEDATPFQLMHAHKMVQKQQIKVAESGVVKGENAQLVAMNTDFATFRKEAREISNSSQTELSKLNRQEALLKNHDGSVMSGAFATFQSFAKSFGLKIGTGLSEKEASEALANQMAIGMRPPSSGVMTDKDFDVYMASVPNRLMSKEGRKFVTQTLRKFHERNVVINDMVMAYAKANGGLIDDGLNAKISAFMQANPVFPPSDSYEGYQAAPQSKRSAETQAIIDIYKDGNLQK